MNLSEILGFHAPMDEGDIFCDDPEGRAFNTALTSCDREIDREALAKELFLMDAKDTITWEDDDVDESIREEYREKSNRIISTMPTWLKRIKE